MAAAFPKKEYEDRLQRVRTAMVAKDLDALVIGDPSNINWLCGYDAWSFYTPQIMLVGLETGPYWLGRDMDAGAASFTTYLESDQIVPFPEEYVQQEHKHPSQYMAKSCAHRRINHAGCLRWRKTRCQAVRSYGRCCCRTDSWHARFWW